MKIVVVGSGISAMATSWAGRAHDLVCWSPTGQFGGQFANGPFRLVRATHNMAMMLDQLDLAFETHETQPGIILGNGRIEPLPDGFARIRSKQYQEMRTEYLEKSRGEWSLKRADIQGMMGEPEHIPATHMDFDFDDFRESIAVDTEIRVGHLVDLDPRDHKATFWTTEGQIVQKYDLLIFTCPSEVIARALPARHAQKMQRNITSPVDIAHVKTPDGIGDRIDTLIGFDVIWTPSTPQRTLMRLSHETEGYACEFKSGATIEALTADLEFALPFGHSVTKIDRAQRGIVTCDPDDGELPKCVHAAGPHATGHMHTLDETLDRIMEILA